MRRVAVGAMVAALFAAPVLAAVADIDTDGDNLASFDEMIVAYPDLTEELFGEIDLNDDGFVDEDEMVSALDTEMIAPASE